MRKGRMRKDGGPPPFLAPDAVNGATPYSRPP